MANVDLSEAQQDRRASATPGVGDTQSGFEEDVDLFAAERRSRRRRLVIATVVGCLCIGYGGRAYGFLGIGDTGDAVLANMLANSFEALAQGVEIITQVRETAERARDAANLVQKTVNTARALQDASAKGVVQHLRGDMLGMYPEVYSAYRAVSGIGSETGVLDWTMTYCLADALKEQTLTDPDTGETITRREWCRRFKASGDGRLLSESWDQLKYADVDAQISALEAQRRMLLYNEQLYQYRLCLHRNVTLCSRYACQFGPTAWSRAHAVDRLPCEQVPPPGQKGVVSLPPLYGLEPKTGSTASCPYPFPQDASPEDVSQEVRQVVCDREARNAQLAEMTTRADGEQSASRQRQLAMLEGLIQEKRAKARLAKVIAAQSDATVEGAEFLEKQTRSGGRIEIGGNGGGTAAMNPMEDK